MRPSRLAVATVAVVAGGLAIPGVASASGPPAVRQLVGVVRLTPGACHHGHPRGSYLAVTFGTRAIRNSSSSCDNGAVTLLAPQDALSTRDYADAGHASFDGEALRLETARASQFRPPRIYLVGSRIDADVRSVLAAYHGGRWPVGAERATGSYDATNHALTMQWFSGQSFTSASAGTEVHLAGTFSGTARRVPQGRTVDLGTASFAAGGSTAVAQAAVQHVRSSSAHHVRSGSRRHHRRRLVAAAASDTSRSPKAFLLDELLVIANLVTFIALARKTRRRGRT